MTDTAAAGPERIVSIRLPEAQTQPPELDGNMRSWGRSGVRPEAVPRAREAEMEAGS
jgi:hypothetical protein